MSLFIFMNISILMSDSHIFFKQKSEKLLKKNSIIISIQAMVNVNVDTLGIN